jgi:hypothetical protein
MLSLDSLGATHLPDSQDRFNYIMEASLSSGSDGFGDVSGRQMFAYLDSRDVMCDSSIPGRKPGPPPTRRPMPDPTPAPVKQPRPPVLAPMPAPVRITRQPVVKPMPAPVRRTLQPVRPPRGNPVPKPTQSPARSPASPNCPKDESVCVARIDKTDRFACFSYADLQPRTCGGVNYVLSKCNNKKVRRNLQEDGCQASCIVLKSLVCLNGSAGDHELEFTGFDSKNRATGDTYIKNIPVLDNQDCVQPRAKCNA